MLFLLFRLSSKKIRVFRVFRCKKKCAGIKQKNVVFVVQVVFKKIRVFRVFRCKKEMRRNKTKNVVFVVQVVFKK